MSDHVRQQATSRGILGSMPHTKHHGRHDHRAVRILAGALTAVAATTGCTHATITTNQGDQATSQNTLTPTSAHTQPKATTSSEPMAVTWTCKGAAGATSTYTSLTQAWAARHDDCTARVTGNLTPLASHAVTLVPTDPTTATPTATSTEVDPDAARHTLESIEGMCARSTPESFDDITATHPHTVAVAKASLVLCPEHPQWVTIARKTAQALVDARSAASAGSIVDGTWRVGVDVKAGTYASSATGTCYWQRTDGSGQIIRNGSVQEGQRGVVTIETGDSGFTSRSCGTWVPVAPSDR